MTIGILYNLAKGRESSRGCQIQGVPFTQLLPTCHPCFWPRPPINKIQTGRGVAAGQQASAEDSFSGEDFGSIKNLQTCRGKWPKHWLSFDTLVVQPTLNIQKSHNHVRWTIYVSSLIQIDTISKGQYDHSRHQDLKWESHLCWSWMDFQEGVGDIELTEVKQKTITTIRCIHHSSWKHIFTIQENQKYINFSLVYNNIFTKDHLSMHVSIFSKKQVGHEPFQGLLHVGNKRSPHNNLIQRYPGSINTKKLSKNSVQRAPLHCHLLHGVLYEKLSHFPQTCEKLLVIEAT